MVNLKYNKLKTATILILLLSTRIYAVESEDVDAILDRLESRLNNSEMSILGIPDSLSTKKKTKPKTVYNMSNQVSGSLTEVNDIQDLATAITKLESNVDNLVSDIQRTKQKVLEDARIDNFINIEATIENSNIAALKSLDVKIDGYEIFSLKEESGFWMPTNSIALFSGPLKPGNHRIDIDARLVIKLKEGLPFNGDVYRFVNKSLSLSIPDVAFKRKITIKIVPPNDLDGKATIEIINKKITQ